MLNSTHRISEVAALVSQVNLDSDNESIHLSPMEGILADFEGTSEYSGPIPTTLEVKQCMVPAVPLSFEEAVRQRLAIEKRKGT
jgi:hypothetical protein